MVARYVGAGLGLLAFFITIISGLYVQNPPEITLSRSLLALFVFCAIGMVLGSAAQMVINEYELDCATSSMPTSEAERSESNGAGPSEESVGQVATDGAV